MIKDIDYFISHAGPDQAYAEWIDHQLRTAGFSVYRKDGFHLGNDFMTEMRNGLQRARCILAVVTPDFFNSKYCMEEWNTAIRRHAGGESDVLLPVRVKPVTMPELDNGRIYLDFVGLDEATARQLLLEKIIPKKSGTVYAPVFPTGASPGNTESTDGTGIAEPPFPETPRTIWNVPFGLSFPFRGRDEHMEALNRGLNESKPSGATALTQVIHGGGGVGKTTLAVQYAWGWRERYRAVLWMSAGSIEALATSINDASMQLVPSLDAAASDDARRAAIIEWLRTHDHWLLIVDNVDTKIVQTALGSFLKYIHTGHRIITSRLDKWPKAYMGRVHVEKWDELTSLDYLRTRLERHRGTYLEVGAQDIARELDGLPLALAQAAAYIEERSISTNEYIKRWRKHAERLMRHPLPYVLGADYDKTVTTTWKMTEAQLSPLARAVLILIGWLAPQPIPRELFAEQAGKIIQVAEALVPGTLAKSPAIQGHTDSEVKKAEVDDDDQAEAVEKALVELSDWSLIQLKQEDVVCHRLLQLTQRWQHGPAWLSRATAWLNTYLRAQPSPWDVSSWSRWEPMRPHLTFLLGCLATQPESADNIEEESWLTSGFASFLEAKAQYKAAEPLFRRALKLREKAHGSNHPDVGTSLNNLAHLHYCLQRYTEAEQHASRAVEIFRKLNDPDGGDIAISLNILAEVFRVQKQFEESERFARQALRILPKASRSGDPRAARNFSTLGLIFQAKGRLSEAEGFFRHALDIVEEVFSHEHPEVAMAMNDLGQLLHTQERTVEAEPLLQRAADIVRSTLGPMHPTTKAIECNLAGLQDKITGS